MAYRCGCGNADTFFEVFDVAVDIVDSSANFIATKTRNVAHYVCTECDHTIPYIEFFPLAASAQR